MPKMRGYVKKLKSYEWSKRRDVNMRERGIILVKRNNGGVLVTWSCGGWTRSQCLPPRPQVLHMRCQCETPLVCDSKQ